MTAALSETTRCRSCGGALIPERLDCGRQPLCNRFLADPAAEEFTHPLVLGACACCGTVQLIDPAPAAEIAPRFDWISYNEPEAHLDRLSDLLLSLPEAAGAKSVAGVSYKDDTTLRRLKERGVGCAWRITPEQLGLAGSRAEIETVQERLTPERAGAIVAAQGAPDLLLVRHILEHAHDVPAFLAALRRLVRPGGLLAFEVPDCVRVLETRDYSAIWEEHLCYFTPETLAWCLRLHGFEPIRIENYPYPLENSLVAIVRAGVPLPTGSAAPAVPEAELQRARGYFCAFPEIRERYRALLDAEGDEAGPIALLGAGHLACSFLNILGLGGKVAMVADDDPNRQGLYLPGSRVPIRPSSELVERGIELCLLSLNPLNEQRAISGQQAFIGSGGSFRSIFPASTLALVP